MKKEKEMSRPDKLPLTTWFIIAAIITGLALVVLTLVGCASETGNGDSTPQLGHTTHVTPPKVWHRDVKPTPAQVKKIKKYHHQPTALCNNGYLTWYPIQHDACQGLVGPADKGIAEWYGGVTT